MNLLFRIVYAAHANGTHHKLALDALQHLRDPDKEHWQRLFLSHSEVYLEGSKAPDTQFKDFKNHVLHVGDNFWGGAPEKVESWYAKLVEALRNQSWHEAVYAAGIMSHYYTDPIHPFHTAQSPAENNIHRAVEWSISKSYDALIARTAARPLPNLEIGDGPGAIKDHVIAGAETSHRHYGTLIAHYDFNRGVVDPPDGLDEVCKELIADLLAYATAGHARLLDRAFAEAGVAPPLVNLSAETFIAALKIPLKWVTRKMTDAADRRQVEAMYDELKATGVVENTLPDDDRQVRESHAREVVAPREQRRDQKRNERRQQNPLPQGQIPKLTSATPPSSQMRTKPAPSSRHSPPDLGARASATVKTVPTLAPAAPPQARSTSVPSLLGALAAVQPTPEMPQAFTRNKDTPNSDAITLNHAPKFAGPAAEPLARLRDRARGDRPNAQPTLSVLQTGEQQPRCHLAPADHIEAAPSIGAKTAARFEAIGIYSVSDFLAADPELTADDLNVRHINAKIIKEWQQQANLVCTLPGIRGGHAQLLVGAGLTSVDAIATVDPGEAMAAILRFAQTSAGQSVLRDGQPPDLEKIVTWVKNARHVSKAA